jgi:hypothetical protein
MTYGSFMNLPRLFAIRQKCVSYEFYMRCKAITPSLKKSRNSKRFDPLLVSSAPADFQKLLICIAKN